MTTLTPQETVERTLALSRTDGCVVILTEGSEANLRWANSSLTTNGAMRSRQLTVVAVVGTGTGAASGTVTRSAVTADGLESLVRAAEAAARAAGPADDAQALVRPEQLPPTLGGDWAAPPAETTTSVFADFAPALGDAFGSARAGGRRLYGFAEHTVTTTYLGTSTGVRLRHDQVGGKVELNGKSSDLAASAWTGVATEDFRDVDVAALDAELARSLGWASRRVDLPAGRYETLLPPSAVADLMIYQYWTGTGRDALDGRTVFSAPGGGTRVGERLTAQPLAMWSDPSLPGMRAEPFVVTGSSSSSASVFDNGLPVGATRWMDDGTLTSLVHTRHSAGLADTVVTPAAGNLVVEAHGATASLEDMVARTERGLLLTCLWYIREVDPQSLLLTGLTRDGVYLVEGGEVVGAVNNFRFNESPVGLLGRVSEVGASVRTLPREWSDYFTLTRMPALRVPDFNMSSVSQAS